MTERSAFDILGVPSTATEATIRSAWKKLAAQHHPDVGGKHETMLAINEAFETALRLIRAGVEPSINKRT
ncbi:MAG: J domain-containing protein, partial [Acidimicrobiaceae bacterium]